MVLKIKFEMNSKDKIELFCYKKNYYDVRMNDFTELNSIYWN